MATTVDHLREGHWVTVLKEFTDSQGTVMRAGDNGVLTHIRFDQLKLEIHLAIEREGEAIALVFPLGAADGPRNGHMREFFELGDEVLEAPEPQAPQDQDEAPEQPVSTNQPTQPTPRQTEDQDRLPEAEQEILDRYDHIGAAASVAEMYAERMRVFRAEGNEPRAVAAFKLAVQWMGTYASWATSGGEGAALSYQRDQFHAQLVSEFGYDPTDAP